RISGRGCFATNWTSSDARFAAELELVFEQSIQPARVHNEQNIVGSLRTDLWSKTPATKIEECRRTPTTFDATTDHALATTTTKNKRGFEHARKDRDRFRGVE